MRLASLGRGARGLWQQATARLPYHLAIRLQRACVQLEGCARTQRYREVERLSRAVLPPGHAPRAVAETARSALLSSSFTGWRLRVLARSPARGPQAPVRVIGLDRLQSLRAARRGAMLVNSQFGVGICVPVALATLGYPLCSVEGMDHLRAAGLPPVPGLRILDLGPEGTFRLPLLRAAQSILEQGGLVHIAGDAYGGTGGVLLPFRGRLRRFAEGFATLAVL
ncbi:MAG TPA: hypothetical protein VLD61_09895, partial [Methylomirabilota bacterium]|nr:hypothetical protein [Methylomirabilota bacterium]